jgi:integrase
LVSHINQQNNFEAVAREWHEKQTECWTPNHTKSVITRLEADVFPHIGHRPIADITAVELLSVIRLIEKRGAIDIAHRAKQTCGQIFRYGVATGRATHDPTVDLKGALKVRKTQNRAYLKEQELPEYLSKLEVYEGEPLTKLALKFLMLTFVRSAELRGALWSEIDWQKSQWRIPAKRMKMLDEHIVPLSVQAIAILHKIRALHNHKELIFPNSRVSSKIMSENTLLYALYRMGYHSRATAHGFRATASTILNENGFSSDVIERQLAHAERNGVRASYNHAEYLPQRHEMMRWWANHVDTLKHNNIVIPFEKISQGI